MYYINFTFYLRHISEFECYEESRDDNKLLCADGHTAEKWNGCIERGSYRLEFETKVHTKVHNHGEDPYPY